MFATFYFPPCFFCWFYSIIIPPSIHCKLTSGIPVDLGNPKGPMANTLCLSWGDWAIGLWSSLIYNSLYWCWLCPCYSSLIILSTCVNSATVPTFIQEFDHKLTNHLVVKMIHPIPIPILRLRRSGWCATIRAFGPKTGTPSALRWAPFRSP